MFTDAELDSMRAEITAHLDETCVVLRPTRTSDGGGGATVALATIATVYGRVVPSGQNESEIGARRGVLGAWTVTLPYGTDVLEGDRITCKGRTWEVGVILEYPHDLSVRMLCRESR